MATIEWKINEEDLKKHWESIKMATVDVSDELIDLWKTYKTTLNHLDVKEYNILNHLVQSMKQFIEVYDDKKNLSQKMLNLYNKLPQQDEEEEDE